VMENRVMENALTELTSRPRPDEKDIFEFLSESYLQVFGLG